MRKNDEMTGAVHTHGWFSNRKKLIVLISILLLCLVMNVISSYVLQANKQNELNKLPESDISLAAADENITVSLKKSARWVDITQGIAEVTLEQQGTKFEEGKDVIVIVDMSSSMTFIRRFVDEIRTDRTWNETFKTTKNIDWRDAGWQFCDCVNPDHWTSGGKHYYAGKGSGAQDDYKYNKGCKDRFQVTMEAVNSFTNKFLNAHTENEIALIGFNETANRAENNNYGTYFVSGQSGINTVKSKLNTMYDNLNLQTHYSDAMDTAKKMIAKRRSEGVNKDTYILFLTDGAPTQGKNGQDEAKELKRDYPDVKIYGIGIADTPVGDYDKYLKPIATSDKTYLIVEKVSELTKQLEDISSKLSYAAVDATLTDTISQYFDYYVDASHPTTPSASLSADGRTLSWSIPEVPETWQTYKFYIKIKDQYVPRILGHK